MRAKRSARERRRGTSRRAAALVHASRSSPTAPIPDCRAPQGLYDPALDKDSCGVGFIADIKGRKSHQIVEDALAIVCNLEHRGAVGADPRAGDGAGILDADPAHFFAKEGQRASASRCPPLGEYAVGALFMPRDPDWRQVIRDIYAQTIKREGMHAARLARRADRQLNARRERQADRAGAPAGVHRPRQEDQERGRVRAPALHPAQVDLEHRSIRGANAGCPTITRCRSPAGRSSTRACSWPTSSAPTIPTCTSRISRARSRWCISASRPTPSRPGRSRIPTG